MKIEKDCVNKTNSKKTNNKSKKQTKTVCINLDRGLFEISPVYKTCYHNDDHIYYYNAGDNYYR